MGKFKQRFCKHEYESLGKYYKYRITEHRNCTDTFSLYIRFFCNKCNKIQDYLLDTKRYRPTIYCLLSDDREGFMRKLEDKGYKNSSDMTEITLRLQLKC